VLRPILSCWDEQSLGCIATSRRNISTEDGDRMFLRNAKSLSTAEARNSAILTYIAVKTSNPAMIRNNIKKL
jgi:hypothetical protein